MFPLGVVVFLHTLLLRHGCFSIGATIAEAERRVTIINSQLYFYWYHHPIIIDGLTLSSHFQQLARNSELYNSARCYIIKGYARHRNTRLQCFAK